MILGLDISTSKIGYAIIDNDEALKEYQVLKFKSDVDLEKRAKIFEEKILNLMVLYDIQQIFVEQPFLAFSGGKTTATTMAKLQRFNGMCCYGLYNVFGSAPVLIPSQRARKTVGITKKRGEDIKKKVIARVSELYPKDFVFEITRHGNPKPGTDDMADAIIVALAGKRLDNI